MRIFLYVCICLFLSQISSCSRNGADFYECNLIHSSVTMDVEGRDRIETMCNQMHPAIVADSMQSGLQDIRMSSGSIDELKQIIVVNQTGDFIVTEVIVDVASSAKPSESVRIKFEVEAKPLAKTHSPFVDTAIKGDFTWAIVSVKGRRYR